MFAEHVLLELGASLQVVAEAVDFLLEAQLADHDFEVNDLLVVLVELGLVSEDVHVEHDVLTQ